MKNKKLWLVGTLSIFGLALIIGTSYAYWRFSKISDGSNAALSGCFSVSLSNEANAISLENAYPISDEDGKKLKPYSFTITNTCSIFAKYYVNLEILEGTALNSKYVAVRGNNENIQLLSEFNEDTNKSLSTSTEARTLATGYLGSGDSIDYSVSFWMDESVTINDTDAMNKNFKSKIMVKAEPSSYSPVDSGYNTLHDAILANEYQTTPEIAIEKIKAKQSSSITDNGDGTYTVTNTAPIIKWAEKTEETQINEVVVPDISVIENDTDNDEISNLTVNDTMMRLYKTRTFNSETGKYMLTDPIYVDPTTLNYNQDINYYYIGQGISRNPSTGKLYSAVSTFGSAIYEITAATKDNTETVWYGNTYASITYKLTVVKSGAVELESDSSDKGLYANFDDYGTTYYYRGNVNNNNVLFGGYYWQIVRINGDGSIRLIYNGSKINAVGLEKSIYNKVSVFNRNFNYPLYSGYMYGDVNATSFDEIHANINDSTIKTTIDEWYKAILADKGFADYITTSVGFCGDRSILSSADGDGIQTNKDTRFASFGRYLNNLATFTCANADRDMYTVAKSDSEIRTIDGNEALTYPVGLITYDELLYSGIDVNHRNVHSWSYSSSHYWTMSPSFYSSNDGMTRAFIQSFEGFPNAWWNVSGGGFSVRPVINLKADVEITGGIGTANDPYVVKTE